MSYCSLSVNGALLDSDGFPPEDVLLVAGPVELALFWPAATVVVTSVVLESLLVSEDPDADELCDSPDTVLVSVMVDVSVMVLPRESEVL